jgi:hypothetical protein
MEMVNITLECEYNGPTYTIPKPVYEYLKRQNDWVESLNSSIKRQMIIQVKIGNFYRENSVEQSQKDWNHFRYHFPSYIVLNGKLSALGLKGLVQEWFDLSSVVYNELALTLPGGYTWKYIEFQDEHYQKPVKSGYFRVIPDLDPIITLQRVAEGLIHIGYDFGIPEPLAEWHLVR